MAEWKSGDSLKAFFKTFKSAATGRWAVSFPTASLVIAEGIIFAIERESRLIKVGSDSRFLVVACGELFGVLFLFFAQDLLLKERKLAAQSFLKCIFVWFGAGVIRGLASALYAHFALGLPLFLFDRISNTVLFTGCGLTVVAYYAGFIENNRAANAGLVSLNQFLEHDEVELNEVSIMARQSALEQLKSSILPKAIQLRELVGNIDIATSGSQAKRELETLRLQSVQLATAVEDERKKLLRDQQIREAEHQYKDIRVNFFTAIFPKTISVRISAIIFAFGALAGQIPRNGINGLKFVAISFILLVPFLYLGSRVSRRLKGVSLFVIYIVTYLASFSMMYLLTYNQSKLGFNLRDSNPPIAAGLKTLSTVYFASVFASLLTDTGRQRESLTFVNESLRTRLDSAHQAHEQLRNHAVSTRFGTIQGKISGVIMALQITHDSQDEHLGTEASVKFLKQVNLLLDDAVLEISSLGK